MTRKIPPEAFHYYAEMGLDRSYQAVADHYGVSKRAITKLAAREDWQRRAADLGSQVREATDKRTFESLEQMNSRQPSRSFRGRRCDRCRSRRPWTPSDFSGSRSSRSD